jgi:hypothetical protein
MRAGLARYLTRAALDRGFRALAEADPDASFEGYDLTEADKEILRRRDHETARLLAEASAAAAGASTPTSPPPVPRTAAADPPPVTGRPLPPADLILQVMAVPSRDEAGGLKLAHVVSLHPAPAPGEPPPPPPPEAPPDALGPVRFFLRLAPHATPLPEGGVVVTYAASLVPRGAEEAAAEPARDASASPAAARRAVGGRGAASPAALRAAGAVRGAAPADRAARLLELLAALEAGGTDAREGA